MKSDRRSVIVEADRAGAAAQVYFSESGARLMGEVATFSDDTAMATCILERVTYVIRIAPIDAETAALKLERASKFSRRSSDERNQP